MLKTSTPKGTKSLILLPILLFLLCTGCKKFYPTDDYDVVNKILRVRITSTNDQPFDVAVIRGADGISMDFSVKQTGTSDATATQADGKPFEFAFSPTVGASINIDVESNEDLLTAYVFYQGSQTWKVYMQKMSDGRYHGTFNYKVVN